MLEVIKHQTGQTDSFWDKQLFLRFKLIFIPHLQKYVKVSSLHQRPSSF